MKNFWKIYIWFSANETHVGMAKGTKNMVGTSIVGYLPTTFVAMSLNDGLFLIFPKFIIFNNWNFFTIGTFVLTINFQRSPWLQTFLAKFMPTQWLHASGHAKQLLMGNIGSINQPVVSTLGTTTKFRHLSLVDIMLQFQLQFVRILLGQIVFKHFQRIMFCLFYNFSCRKIKLEIKKK